MVRFISSKKSYYLPISGYPSHLVLHSSFSENRENDIYEGNYIDFTSNNKIDFLVFYLFSLNQLIEVELETVLEYENVNITDYTLITKQMALEMFIDSDINITNHIGSYSYKGLYVSSHSEHASSVSLDSVSSNILNDEEREKKTISNSGIFY